MPLVPVMADALAGAAGASPILAGHWAAFAAFVVVMLTLDLTVFHRTAHEPSLKESIFWTCFWAALALSFNALVWWWLGGRAAIEFLEGEGRAIVQAISRERSSHGVAEYDQPPVARTADEV